MVMKRLCHAAMPAALAAMLALAGAGCRRSVPSSAPADGEMLVAIGDSSLWLRDVVARIPGGLSPDDSVALFNSIVDSWVESILLQQLGRDNIEDMDRIDRMVEQYRARLIAREYRRRMRESEHTAASDDSIAAYYESHAAEMVLPRPLVKGILLKLPADSPSLDDARRWLFSGTPEGIDNLENSALGDALLYSFFQDRWVDWQQVAEQIPYRFYDADAFVESQRNFETTYRGTTYLLHISDHRLSGSPMPVEYARPIIAGLLDTESAAAYERRLVQSLKEQARRDGRLRNGSFDPLTHRYTPRASAPSEK